MLFKQFCQNKAKIDWIRIYHILAARQYVNVSCLNHLQCLDASKLSISCHGQILLEVAIFTTFSGPELLVVKSWSSTPDNMLCWLFWEVFDLALSQLLSAYLSVSCTYIYLQSLLVEAIHKQTSYKCWSKSGKWSINLPNSPITIEGRISNKFLQFSNLCLLSFCF